MKKVDFENKLMRSLNEITILASGKPTDIVSRKNVDPYTDGKLPVFVSPMTCVINKDNFDVFDKSNVIPILPRYKSVWKDGETPFTLADRVKFSLDRNAWIAVSEKEFEEIISGNFDGNHLHILIDVAQGHMKSIYSFARSAKDKYPEMKIMAGNIAHPNMYMECRLAGIDYVRVSVGSGSACSTSMITGVHSSMVWLLNGIGQIKTSIEEFSKQLIPIQETFSSDYTWDDYTKDDLRRAAQTDTKVIADGGLNSIDKIVKCLSLGADYVMLGKGFAECEEACGETKQEKVSLPPKVENGVALLVDTYKMVTYRHYYGMASEQGQLDIHGEITRTPEGLDMWILVTGTLKDFTTKIEDGLRSAMSYTNSHTLEDFKNVKHGIMSIAEYNEYYKK